MVERYDKAWHYYSTPHPPYWNIKITANQNELNNQEQKSFEKWLQGLLKLSVYWFCVKLIVLYLRKHKD